MPQTPSHPVSSPEIPHSFPHDITELKRTEQEHLLLSAIVTASDDAILSKTLDGIITTWNPAAERMFGYTAEEIIGKPKTILFPPERLQEEEVILERLNRGLSTDPFETVRIRKDGTLIDVSVTISPIKDSSGQVVGASTIAHDITKYKQSEAIMQDAIERFRLATLSGGLAVWEYDILTNVLTWDERMMTLYGHTPETFPGAYEAWSERLHPDDKAMAEAALQTAIEGGEKYTPEFRILLPDGTIRYIKADALVLKDTRGIPVRMIGLNVDISERKMTELALRKSQENLALAQHVARMGSWEYDLATGKISWSPQLFHLMGLEPAQGEPDYMTNLALYESEDAARLDACVQKAVSEGEGYSLELRRSVMSGQSTRWYHAVGKVERDETGQVVRLFGTMTDITQHKTIEGAMLMSQKRLNYAQAITHVGSWEQDYRHETMVWSEELFRLCGLESSADMPDIQTLYSYIHPLDLQRTRECMQQARRDGIGADFEMRLVGADGVLRYVHLRTEIIKGEMGQAIGSHGTVTEVTDQIKALQEQTKFVSLIENSSDFIAIASLDCVLMTMNPAGRKLVGLKRIEEVPTALLPEFLPSDVWDRMKQDVLPIVMREGRWEGESQLVNVATGKVHDMQSSYFLIHNPVSGEPMCLATVQRDITERKRVDESILKMTAELTRSNTDLEQFAYVASHDLQEPLRMIGSYLELLELEYKDRLDCEAHEYIAYAVDGAIRMKCLINDLLSYSRVGTQGKPMETISANSLLMEVLTDLQMLIEETGAIITCDPLPAVSADRSQLRLVFQNLIGNAIKFRGAEPPRVHLSATDVDGEWRFCFQDNGIGMKAQHTERIFVIFQRLHNKSKYAGTGIGLAVCKRVIERHGGRIWVESEPGNGSAFFFTLPAIGMDKSTLLQGNELWL